MNKITILLVLAVVCHLNAEILDLGKRPKWYPEDAAEIEAECAEEHNVTAEKLADIQKLQIDNTPAVRAYILCALKETNVYRPDKGPEIKRIAVALQQSQKLNMCDLDMIRDCVEANEGSELKDYAFFNIMKCVYEKAPARCLEKVAN